MDEENFLSENNQNYVIRINGDNLIENVEIFDRSNKQVKSLEVEHFESEISIKSILNFTNENFAYNFSKISCHLKSGMLLVHSNTFYERTSRDGVDLSTDHYFVKLVNINSLRYNYISLKKDRFDNSENTVGEFYGIFSFKISENNRISFNVFDNLVISNCIFNKYIIYASEIGVQEVLEIFDIGVKLPLKEKYSLIREKSFFTMIDTDFKVIIEKANLFDIIEFFLSQDFKIQEYFAVIKTIENI